MHRITHFFKSVAWFDLIFATIGVTIALMIISCIGYVGIFLANPIWTLYNSITSLNFLLQVPIFLVIGVGILFFTGFLLMTGLLLWYAYNEPLT